MNDQSRLTSDVINGPEVSLGAMALFFGKSLNDPLSQMT